MLYLVVALAVIAGGWMLHHCSEARRGRVLEAAARQLGLKFRSGLPAGLNDVLYRFRVVEKALQRGEFQAGINSITGVWRDRNVAFFDFQWTTSRYTSFRSWSDWASTDRRQVRRTWRRSAVAVELGVGLPPMILRPERLVDKAAALAGYEDIDFSRLPEFSRKFYVNSPDPVAARRLVTPELARFFMENVRVTVDIVGPWMLLHHDGVLAPGRVPPLMDLGVRLSELITREQAGSR